MSGRRYEMDMCNGPLFSKILTFSIPLILSGILQLLFNAADMVVAGRFAGSVALGAVGATSSLINLLINVFVGMSGGVDNSVAALLLQREGYQLSGINLCLLRRSECAEDRSGTADAEDARAVAARLGIPFHTVDLSERFREIVIRNFIEEYEAGRTPNPCILCNRTIKFGAMLDEILKLGGDCVATGHYAQVMQDPETGRWLLKRGADHRKDQSYFLYRLTQEQLSRTLFPLGGLEKEQVRRIAEENGLINANKRDSQDICFVPDGNYAAFIERTTGKVSPTGDFLDAEGRVLGRHKGFIRYTKGQHKGLGLPTAEPLYVLRKDPDSCAICLGPDSDLWTNELVAEEMNWISIPALTESLRVTAKTRYSHRESAAVVEPLVEGRVHVVFDEPQRAVTAGQAVVLYDGELVVGGGTICE